MFRTAFLSISATTAALLCAAPALAEPAPAAESEAPALCRVALDVQAGACNTGHDANFALDGGRLARAIMFFGGPRAGVRLVEPAPNASTASARLGEGGLVRPARLLLPSARPAFVAPLLTY